ncbi:phage portal protein [Undibacterium curvum]|uniref:Phage portal protein n=1 Tax=Undibacterium curvum TaxID=2762294 RepID=A0ABR7A5A5_9BURK|nr:phage portal protein [Undibacterium curvum]MBC3931986.1 phage portal protein [Undibacterium curvum]
MKWLNSVKSALGFAPKNETQIPWNSAQSLEFLSGMPASAGVYVTPENAQRLATVYACCDKVAGAISTLPLGLYKRTKTVRDEVHDHPVHALLNERPSAAWTAADAKFKAMLYVMLRGDGYMLIKRNRMGEVKELIQVPWEVCNPIKQEPTLESRIVYAVSDGLSMKGWDMDDVLHFAGYGFNGLSSMSVISWGAKNAIGNALAMDEYSGRYFADGAHASLVLKQDSGGMDQKKIDFLRAQIRELFGGLRNAHKHPLILPPGISSENVSITASDAQLLEARKFQVIDICRAFGVPPHMIGETSASTSWGSGIESINRGFLTYTLNPRLVKIEEEINHKLMRGTGMFFEFDRSSMLEGDAKTQGEFFRGALGGPGSGPGWMTTNEVRGRRNLAPVPGGDVLFDPNAGKTTGGKSEKD